MLVKDIISNEISKTLMDLKLSLQKEEHHKLTIAENKSLAEQRAKEISFEELYVIQEKHKKYPIKFQPFKYVL